MASVKRRRFGFRSGSQDAAASVPPQTSSDRSQEGSGDNASHNLHGTGRPPASDTTEGGFQAVLSPRSREQQKSPRGAPSAGTVPLKSPRTRGGRTAASVSVPPQASSTSSVDASQSLKRGSRSGVDAGPRTVLVAGATGYLGRHTVKALTDRGFSVKSLCRPTSSRSELEVMSEIVTGDVTKPPLNLSRHLASVDVVVSCLGSPLLGDAEKIDRDGTIRLFNEAAAAGVKHFIMVSVFGGRATREFIGSIRAKEEAVDYVMQEAAAKGITWTVMRPTGFFKDMDEVFKRVAQTGKFSMIGDGTAGLNPISGADLASRICDCITNSSDWNTDIDVGGPEVYSIKEIGNLVFETADCPPVFEHVPEWLVGVAEWFFSTFGLCLPVCERYCDAVRFIRYITTNDNIADASGSDRLGPHFQELAAELKREKAPGGLHAQISGSTAR